MANNNFLVWNPNAVNQDTDGEYLVETQRTNGAVSGLFPSKIANKLFYQCSMMAAGMGEMMKNKGFEMSDAVFADLITSLSHILTDAQFGSSAGTVCQGNDPRLDKELPLTTKAWFWQDVAPTGWTIDPTAADAVIAVKAGSGTYAVAGGTTAGTWTQPTHSHTINASDVTLPAHTHSVSITTGGESAGHTHTYSGTTGVESAVHGHSYFHAFGVTGGYGYGSGAASGATLRTGDQDAFHTHSFSGTTSGRSAGHTHAVSGSTANAGSGSGSHTHTESASATANTYRPLANVGIICERSA
jgi:hypothetical protein